MLRSILSFMLQHYFVESARYYYVSIAQETLAKLLVGRPAYAAPFAPTIEGVGVTDIDQIKLSNAWTRFSRYYFPFVHKVKKVRGGNRILWLSNDTNMVLIGPTVWPQSTNVTDGRNWYSILMTNLECRSSQRLWPQSSNSNSLLQSLNFSLMFRHVFVDDVIIPLSWRLARLEMIDR